jgi:hypothetical protein
VHQIRGSIPSNMGQLTRLEMLQLQHNKLEGDLPSELAWMENMKDLKLGANDLRGEIFELDRMTNLRCVSIDFNLTKLRLRLDAPLPWCSQAAPSSCDAHLALTQHGCLTTVAGLPACLSRIGFVRVAHYVDIATLYAGRSHWNTIA